MNILEEIIAFKSKELARSRSLMPAQTLERSTLFSRTTFSLRSFLLAPNASGIIAEFKRLSPSKGIINRTATPADVTRAYTENGASALSVLTDSHFFGGSADDLSQARSNLIPILRKDFIIDEYQVLEAKAMGADVVLLIAACLSPRRTLELASLARQLHMEVLLEVHHEGELNHICDAIDHVGVNNRNLKTFSVDMRKSFELAELIPAGKIRIAESGINTVDRVLEFRKAGFSGFLIGEHFMRERDPGKAFSDFIEKLRTKQKSTL